MEAKRDGDRIYAVIRGLGTSSAGRAKSIYAPRPAGQIKALKRAYEDAGISPATLGLLEAHGTGTSLGDPIEVLALGKVFKSSREHKLKIGSVKTNFGHLEVKTK